MEEFFWMGDHKKKKNDAAYLLASHLSTPLFPLGSHSHSILATSGAYESGGMILSCHRLDLSSHHLGHTIPQRLSDIRLKFRSFKAEVQAQILSSQ